MFQVSEHQAATVESVLTLVCNSLVHVTIHLEMNHTNSFLSKLGPRREKKMLSSKVLFCKDRIEVLYTCLRSEELFPCHLAVVDITPVG